MTMKNDNFYVTTPIYYVNDVPHLGTAYCTIAADVLARYERLSGHTVNFLTGTDEHGEKIEEAAQKKNKTPLNFTDEVSRAFINAWKKLNISNDDFIRTTEERHKKVVTHFVEKALENGSIYLGDYEGWYCVSDESFWTESQLVNGRCPTCTREVKKIKEENYFFKLSEFVGKLKEHIEKNPDFILPESKRNEVLGFLKEEIRDISISRTSFTWGIPFPKGSTQPKQNHVIYVWFDALINYISALNPLDEKSEKFNSFWGTLDKSKAIHLVGKDILRFHAVYWPAFLMSVGLPLPKRIFAHGWWTIEGQKMSKSLGNAIDPLSFTATYGVDAFRLFLFREFPMGQDGDFSLKNFKERANADLANNLGNLVSRTLNLIQKNNEGKVFQGELAKVSENEDLKNLVLNPCKVLRELYLNKENFEKFNYSLILQNIFGTLNGINKYLEVKAPWTLAKDPAKRHEMLEVLNTSAEVIRLTAIMLWPFIPSTSEEILRRLGQDSFEDLLKASLDSHGDALKKVLAWGIGKPATVEVGSSLFARLV
jgi:methionyl-tRNA synthetase